MGRRRIYPGEAKERRRLSRQSYRESTGSMDLKKSVLSEIDAILNSRRDSFPIPGDTPKPLKSRADVVEYLVLLYQRGRLTQGDQ